MQQNNNKDCWAIAVELFGERLNPFLSVLLCLGCYDNNFSNENNLQTSSYEGKWIIFLLDVQINHLVDHKRGRALLKRCDKETLKETIAEQQPWEGVTIL